MDLDAVDGEDRFKCAEAFVLQLPELGPVERVGASCAKALEVKAGCPPADLLVGGERHPNRRTRKLRMGGEVRNGRHDLGHASLVVGPEQGVAAGGDEVVAGLVS